MFRYSAIEWENLKYDFIFSQGKKLEYFSYEYQKQQGNENYTDFPFLSELKTRAERDGWSSLASDSSELKSRFLMEHGAESLREKLNALGYLNRTVDFSRRVQTMLASVIDTLEDAMKRKSQIYDMEPIDRAKYLKMVIDCYKEMNKLEKESIGLTDIKQIVGEIYRNFGEGKTLEEILTEVEGVNEQDLTDIVNEIMKSQKV
jgi:hypothetical protein